MLASCGDFQDPVPGSVVATASHPSRVTVPQQEISGTGNQLTSGASGEVVDPASQPITSGTAPASTEPTVTGSQGDARATEFAPGQSSPSPQSGTAQSSTGEGTTVTPWRSSDGPPPGPVTLENRLQKKLATFSWDPPSSGNVVNGYRAYITTLSTTMRFIIDIGLETRFSVDLPIGERYEVTVTAYNDGGESPPAVPVQFDFF